MDVRTGTVMAAPSSSSIRVRLHFDYPPPAVADCRMCWLLVDLNTCRVVSDLESLIRDKFGFGRRSVLNLFMEDCYLPHTESVFVVRDNDRVRVKVDSLPQVNGHSSCPDTAAENSRKRQRPTEEEEEKEDGLAENGVSVEWKKKKRKKRSEESLETATKQVTEGEEKKKKKKKRKAAENGPTVTPKPAAAPTKTTPAKPVKNTKKPPTKPQSVSSSESSSSDKDEAPKKTATPKPAARTSPAAPKAPPATKPTLKKTQAASSSSSGSSSSSDEATAVKNKLLTPKGGTREQSKPQQTKQAAQKQAAQTQQAAQKQAAQTQQAAQKQAAQTQADKTSASSSSDSEEEIKLVIRRPVQQQLGQAAGSPAAWRGCGRGQPWRDGGPGERGRGGGTPPGRGGGRGTPPGGGRGGGRGHSFEFGSNGAKEPSYQTDTLTNVSTVLQNGAAAPPKQDYSSMPLLAAPPQVGQKIAFKLLELTENYTPEVSEYKEGKIVSFDLTTKQIELELLHKSRAPVEPGKFDLVYQNPDGSESVEYAVSRGSRVTERWDSLLEPRLVI